ncbi:P-loop nucleoside triphosphate hydrolase superfamily protein with CH (Calponin Homology) domain [Zea mays]|uniref:p-loop nucleoside triphosphate hydrolase superfamily protein with CH (Calponin Homology) domain n=1 Tax=Zea mays TaxID=4577 RepID=A0A1D6IWA0_MAIZE|nr:P-loop nucleoside triphosphate hydrolase superfamily protein with CH (Calponin Homology) domain [Zea mays]
MAMAAAVLEEALRWGGGSVGDDNVAARRAEEAAIRRHEAASWLRKTVGIVCAKDLPEEPSEEEFQLGLRNGIVLCNALNKVQPGAIPKIVGVQSDTAVPADGSALCAYQYFENLRNFVVVIQDFGLPTFEVSDLEKGGKSVRIVDCVLALKSFSEKEATLNGFRGEQNLSLDCSPESYEITSDNLSTIIRTILLDKKPEEIPLIVESLLNKVIQEYELRFANQNLMDEEKQNNLTTKEEASFAVNGSNAAQKFHLKAEINFDLQHKQIKGLRGTVSSIKSGMEQLKLHYSEEFTKLGKHLYTISNAASGYHKVLEENRKLYNQIQDLKGNIRVYCRVRPFLPGQISSLSSVAGMEERTITIMTPTKYGKDGNKSFTFNKVFGPAATQDEVFSDMQPLIRSVLDGFNVCIFAYGQTGSGKTYTMSGPKVLTEESLATLEIKNTSQKGLAVPDASIVPVTSTSDVVELMNQGQKNRAVGSTAINDRSSRSHSCLTVHVQGRDLTSGTVLRGCMHLVDLAGSERVDKSEVVGDRLKEAQYINKSLSALGDVIASLSQKNTHVPYRNSKLTQLLQDSLGGQAKTLMFVHISPELDAAGETISTLKFAERVASVELGAAKQNKEGSEIRELKEQIASLKAALAKKEGEPENILSTRSSPSIYRIRKGNATPATPKDRQPMEEVGSLEVQNVFTPAQKRSKMHLLGILTENNSSNSVQNCNVPQKEIGLGGWVDKMALGDNHFENSNSILELEPDTAQLPTSFYHQRYSPVQQSCRTESVPSLGLHGFDSATSCSNQEIVVSTMGLKASGVANRGASTVKKYEATSTRSTNLASKSPLLQKKLQTPTRNRNQLTSSTIGGRRTPNGKIGIAK